MRRTRLRRTTFAPVAALLASAMVLLGVCIVARAAPGQSHLVERQTAGTGRHAEPNIAVRPATSARVAEAATYERPVASRLPSGKVVAVRPVASDPDGRPTVPADLRIAGWWREGARLGDPFGSILLAAHTDPLTRGLGPYAELRSARPGQRVVLRSAHLRESFVVRSLHLVSRSSVADRRWIYSVRGPRRLVLVTCAGPYLPGHGYQNLAVVTALPVSGPQDRDR